MVFKKDNPESPKYSSENKVIKISISNVFMKICSQPSNQIYEVNITYIDPVTEDRKEFSRIIRGHNAHNAMAFCLVEAAEDVSRKSRSKINPEVDYAELTISAKPYEEIKENNLEDLTEKEPEELVLAQN